MYLIDQLEKIYTYLEVEVKDDEDRRRYGDMVDEFYHLWEDGLTWRDIRQRLEEMRQEG